MDEPTTFRKTLRETLSRLVHPDEMRRFVDEYPFLGDGVHETICSLKDDYTPGMLERPYAFAQEFTDDELATLRSFFDWIADVDDVDQIKAAAAKLLALLPDTL